MWQIVNSTVCLYICAVDVYFLQGETFSQQFLLHNLHYFRYDLIALAESCTSINKHVGPGPSLNLGSFLYLCHPRICYRGDVHSSVGVCCQCELEISGSHQCLVFIYLWCIYFSHREDVPLAKGDGSVVAPPGHLCVLDLSVGILHRFATDSV